MVGDAMGGSFHSAHLQTNFTVCGRSKPPSFLLILCLLECRIIHLNMPGRECAILEIRSSFAEIVFKSGLILILEAIEMLGYCCIGD